MLFADIVRRVRESTGDMAVLQYADSTLTDWMNDAVRECVAENSLLQVRGSAVTVVGQQEYTFPADMFKIHSVYYEGRKLRIITLSEWEDAGLNELLDTGESQFGCFYAGKLALSPIPNKIVNLTLNYSKYPVDTVYNPVGPAWNPTTPSIPEAFHARIVTYCMAQVALQDDDYGKYQALMLEFKTGVIDLKHLKDETENLYPFMHYVDRDMEI